MKTVSLLLLAGLLSTETLEAAVAAPTAASRPTTLSASSSANKLVASDASKRRKRRKSRPAYKRLGVELAPVTQHATA